MDFSFVLALAAVTAPSAATSLIAPNSISPSAERDLQCLTLAFVAAGTEKDPTKLQAAIAASWYFLGRLDIGAPGIDLDQATKRALASMTGDPLTKEIGAACDAQFTGRGADLVNLGKNRAQETKQ